MAFRCGCNYGDVIETSTSFICVLQDDRHGTLKYQRKIVEYFRESKRAKWQANMASSSHLLFVEFAEKLQLILDEYHCVEFLSKCLFYEKRKRF